MINNEGGGQVSRTLPPSPTISKSTPLVVEYFAGPASSGFAMTVACMAGRELPRRSACRCEPVTP